RQSRSSCALSLGVILSVVLPVSGQEKLTIDSVRTPMQAVVFSPDGKLLAFGGDGGAITLWDVPGKKARATLSGLHTHLLSLAFSPDGKTLASSGPQRQGNTFSGLVHLWDVEKGEVRFSLTSPSPGSALCYSPDGKTLFTGPGREETDIILWDLEKG